MRKGRDGEEKKEKEIKKIKKITAEMVATNVVASRPTATPTARANIYSV